MYAKDKEDSKITKVFHLCRESHEVPKQNQRAHVDDDMILCGVGGQEHAHLCGDRGDGRHGGGIGKGNGIPPLIDEEEDWDIDVGRL